MPTAKTLTTRIAIAVIAMSGALMAPLGASVASAATPPTLNLNVLLIGGATTAAWQSALSSEGVAYTLVTPSGAYGSETMTLPTLSSGTTANFDGVVFADSPFAFAAGQLTTLDAFESQFQIRQVDGYEYPSTLLGETEVSSGSIAGTTGTLNAAGLAALPALKGPVPFDVGTLGYGATVNTGAPFTPWLTSSTGTVLAGVYQHPNGDAQSGVTELTLNFDYLATSLEWLLLSPGIINWVTQSTHVGLYRNYFGQDIDDNFIADNEWSSKYQCTPAATDPIDFTCPAGVAGNTADEPADVQMSAADVAYVVAWEAQTGITLNMAFNGVGACTAPTAAAESNAKCTGSITENGTTYTMPGQVVDSTSPNDQGLINALLADQKDFNWTTHTWSHEFLGCVIWQQQPFTSATAATGGTLAAGTYDYEITAATAYGESEPSVAKAVTLSTTHSATLTWPDATNGTGTAGAGPKLWQEEANHTGGTGFWGYNIYRKTSTGATYGYIGHVAEDPTGATANYTFTDTGAVTPGVAPDSSTTDPTATNPGIDCANGTTAWDPANDPNGQTDASIDTEIAWDQEFAAANGLTNYSPAVVITGEHSGIENPNMPAALHNVGVNVFAADASRQPQQYALSSGGTTAESAPRYPSNIYYNASNWPDEINEYNTLYVAPGVSLGNTTYPSETGHCAASGATTCLTTPATETSILASESSIMLSHVLANNPRVGYAHQTDLIGPAATGYTILSLINSMLSQYNAWTTTPLTPMNDATEATVLGEQAAWASAQSAKSVTATDTNGVVTITNTSAAPITVPFSAPLGSTVGGAAYGQAYGGTLSAWTTIAAKGTLVVDEKVAPTITSANAATSIVGTPFSFTVHTTGAPSPALSFTGSLPTGIAFLDNGNGTATISGTAAAGTGGTFAITITAASSAGTTTQSFTLTNAQAPTITSAAAAQFYTGFASTYTVTTTGSPTPTIAETGALPSTMTFKDNGNGTATITGTPPAGSNGTYPVTITAKNSSGSTATLDLVITVSTSSAPAITSSAAADFASGTAGSVAVTTTGVPTPALTYTGTLPTGIGFKDNGNGTATISGSSTQVGAFPIVVTAANGVTPNAQQTLTVNVGTAPTVSNAAPPAATVGTPYSFKVTTTGFPAPALGISAGTLPPGLTFTDNKDGTATIAGTPLPGFQVDSPFNFTVTATNYVNTSSLALSIALGASSITQVAPTSDSTTVDLSSAYTKQLNVTGNNGAVNFTATGGSTTDLSIGFSGIVKTSGYLAAGTYNLNGTDVDGNGDKGTWSFALTVTPSTITQTTPTSASVTVDSSGTTPLVAQLAPGTHDASAITYATTVTSTSVSVSSTGAVTVTGGPIRVGTYTVSGTDSDTLKDTGTWTFTLTVTPSTITQIGITGATSAVDASSTTTTQLTTSGSNGGSVTFAPTSGDETDLKVTAAGLVSTAGYLKVGTYTFGGASTDADGDTGTWTFTLTVTPSTILQTTPLTGTTSVDTSSAFTDQLAPSTHDGSAVSYVASPTNANISVSASGAIRVIGAPLKVGAYTVSGTDSDTLSDTGTWTFTLTVTPSTITQTSPTTATVSVDNSSAFTGQLAPTTHDSTAVTYVTVVKSTGLNVSSSGAITTNAVPLAVNTYTVSGTDTDALGDTGTWTFALTVTPVVIVQTSPTSASAAVDSSSGYTGQIVPTTHDGSAVSYVTTVTNSNVAVSSAGAISVTGGPLKVGAYTASGTDTDTLGDAGTWTFTLNVTPSTISQIGLTTDTTTVDGSSAYTGQLTTSGSNGGGVAFVASTGNTTSLKVSASGLVSTSGYLKVGSYTFGGTDTDADGDTGTWTFTLTVTASAIIQTTPLTGTTTVDSSSAFTGQLAPATHDASAVSYVATVLNAHLSVSSSGAISVVGAPLAVGVYTVSGTDSDALGDAGTWTFTLSVTPSTILQTTPLTGTTSVDGSSTFTGQLAPATHDSTAVAYVTVVKSSGLNVSSSGAITTNGVSLAATTYTVSGTDTDALGDTGTWTYTLTVTPSAILQTSPTSASVTVDSSSSYTGEIVPTTHDGSAVTYLTTTTNPNVSVSSAGAITVTGGPLKVGTYTVSGTTSDGLGDAGTWTFTLTVTPSTISQIGLTTDTTTVDGSSAYTGQLTTSGSNGGGVTFVATTGNTTSLKVSTGGPVSTSGYLKVGSYTFGGTDTDADGDTGTWTFTLTVTASAIVQSAPLTGTTTVDNSSSFTDQLAPATHDASAVSFTTVTTNAGLKVSSSGAITTVGAPLSVGQYNVAGTVTDTLGDVGTWQYTLTVTASPIVQAIPTGDTITVDQTVGFTDQLAPATHDASAVVFTTTSSNPSLNVSAGGAITLVSSPLGVGHYTVSGTDADGFGDAGTWTYTLTVTASLITQAKPTSDTTTVDGSGAYTTPLAVTGNNGTVSYTATGGDTTHLLISSQGVVTTSGMLVVGNYTFSGTDSDVNGDAGTWTFTLSVSPSAITQIGLVTDTSTVDGSSTYRGQLSTSGSNGTETFSANAGDTTDLKVSAAGVVTVNGYLAVGSYEFGGTVTDSFGDAGAWTFTLKVSASTIDQGVPTGDVLTVDGSTTFADQLASTTHDGSHVTFVTVVTNPHLTVSSSGAVSASGTPLPIGSYTVSGTDSDTLGDTGTWTYTLQITASLISQVVPTGSNTTVNNSATASDQLNVTGNNGAVTYIATGGDTTDLTVSPTGAVSTNGMLSAGVHTFSGTDSDVSGDAGQWSYSLTVAAGTISQIGLTSDSTGVDATSGYSAQLSATGNNGAVGYTVTAGDSSDLSVSATGQVTTTGYLDVGSYTISGTLGDAFGDTGTWTFTLVVTASTISQSAPTSASITVDQTSGFTNQLAPVTHDGTAIVYTVTGTNPNVSVSGSGAIAVVGAPLAANTYTVSGTDTDAFGDTGTWTFSINVTANPIGGGGGTGGGGTGGGGTGGGGTGGGGTGGGRAHATRRLLGCERDARALPGALPAEDGGPVRGRLRAGGDRGRRRR